MNFAIIHHDDFIEGTDIGYGIGMSRDETTRQAQQAARVSQAVLSDRYHVAGTVEADDAENAYWKTQNGMPFTAPGWAARSTSVGDLLYAGDDEPHLWLVRSVGMLDLGPCGPQVMVRFDREALAIERARRA